MKDGKFWHRFFRQLTCDHTWGPKHVVLCEQGDPINIPDTSITKFISFCTRCKKARTWAY